MAAFRKFVKNVLPYYFVKKYYEGNPYAPGGYYSPIPSEEDIEGYDFKGPLPERLPGIDLNDAEQMNLLNSFETFYNELPFTNEKKEGLRYYYKNGYYGPSDAIILYCMIRQLTPKKIIEVGSGFSSCVILDTNELFLGDAMNCTFIEPYPERLESLLVNGKSEHCTIHKKKLQEIPLEVFKELEENDILFIDSTHVSKLNSDVNYVIHEILPALASGVHIHIHDVFYPFEYPKQWLLSTWYWNEQYILRAFLQYNDKFKIIMFNTFLENMYEEEIKSRFPLLYKNETGLLYENTGGSIWLKKM